MWEQIKKWYTLRNQILIVFLLVMMIVLAIVSFITLRQVSELVKANAEEQIKQTAIEASGRFDSLFEQLNTATKFIITNPNVQDIYKRTHRGEQIHFSELQRLNSIVSNIQANSEGIYSVELYANNLEQLLPLDDSNRMFKRVNVKWINRAFRGKGELVWIGEDSKNSNYYLALRRINLMDQNFTGVGYLLVSINKSYLQIAEKYSSDQYLLLLDEDLKPIFSNFPGKPNPANFVNQPTMVVKDKEYIVTKEISKETNFTVVILTPVSKLTKGLDKIRMGIVLSGIMGIFIYLLCSWFLSNRITRPIIHLTNNMKLANEGLMTVNPDVLSVSEINELNSTYNQLAKETNYLIKMIYQKEIIRSRSELKALQAQINPHFLYNTLDSLRWALEDKREEELADVVVAMSNLFRYTISKSSEYDWISLDQEFKHIENYMEIIKFRFGERIQWNLTLEKECANVIIPKLLIQPLVENAVIHGSEGKLTPCTIKVTAEKEPARNIVRITVQDDGIGMSEEKLASIRGAFEQESISSERGEGMAFINIIKRLNYYYKEGAENNFIIDSRKNEGTIVTIYVPVSGDEG